MFPGSVHYGLALIALGLAGGSQVAAASAICVTVSDLGGQPLGNARVTAVNLHSDTAVAVWTGADGRACTEQIPEGQYAVEVGLPGFLNVRYYPVRVSFPAGANLRFQMPFGEIGEGGIGPDAIVSGTFTDRGEPVAGVEVGLRERKASVPVTCTTTTDLGEYALSIRPGTYDVELRRAGTVLNRSEIRIPTPGVYRNRVALVRGKANR